MTDLVFDIYPADDPLSGTKLVRLTSDDVLQGSGYRAERRGPGVGTIKLSAKHTAVTSGYLVEKNYVRVIDLDLGASGEVIGGMWLNEGEEVVLSEDEGGGKILSYTGQGQLYYLHNEVMGDTALSASAGPHDQDLIDANGRWSWGVGGGETYGGILRRAIIEAILKSPSGISALSSSLINWDDDDDSASAAWPAILASGERFEINVGDNLLDVTAMMMSTGSIDLYMDPDTFQIDALIADTDGTDRTGTSFGTGVVRFLGGTNIASDLKKAIHESARVTHMLVIGSDGVTFANVVDPDWSAGDLVIRGAIRVDSTNDSDALEAAGLKSIADRKLQTDSATFPHVPGDDESTGEYTPGKTNGHYWLGDQVTLHTGTGTNDYNNQTMRVAAINWVMREAGDWDIQPELGATYVSMSRAAFDARTGGGCNCGPTLRLCDPTLVASAEVLEDYLFYSWEEGATDDGGGGVDWTVDRRSGGDQLPGDTFLAHKGTSAGESPRFPVTAEQGYRVSGFTRHNIANGDGGFTITVTFLDAGLSEIADSSVLVAEISPDGVWTEFTDAVTAPVDAAYMRLDFSAGGGNYDQIRIQTITAAAATGANPLNGTDPCSAHGDHGHVAFSASAPTVDDDLTAGYRKGTFWYDTATDTLYVSSDDTDGAAVWEEVGGLSEVAAQALIDDSIDTHKAATDPHTGYVKESEFTGAGDVLVGTGSGTLAKRKNNDSATAAPGTGDDSGDGYEVGSRWIDTTNDKEYVCLDATATAAVWTETTGGGSALTVEEADGSPTDSAVTKIKFPNGSLAIASHEATYTPLGPMINTDANAGTNIYVGATDPDGTYTLAEGDVWIDTGA